MKRIGLGLGALLCALAVVVGQAQAQVSDFTPPPYSAIDANGVDLSSGSFNLSETQVSIGPHDQSGLSRTLIGTGARDNFTATINTSTMMIGTTNFNVYTVSIGGGSAVFIQPVGYSSISSYIGSQGQSLSFDAATGLYTHTGRDGTATVFSQALAQSWPISSAGGQVVSQTRPTGEQLTYAYKSISGTGGATFFRLQAVTSNRGYMIKYDYTSDVPVIDNPTLLSDYNLIKVTAINLSVEYCDPMSDSCALSNVWPSATISGSPSASYTFTVTDALSRVTTYAVSGGRISSIQRPGGATTSITYNSDNRVQSVSNGLATWTYAYSVHTDTGDLFTTVTDPLGHTRQVWTHMNTGRVFYDADGLGNATTYDISTGAYAPGLLNSVTKPELNSTAYTYDSYAGGKVVAITQAAKPGSGLTNIVTSAGYDATWTNQVAYTIDANGNRTDYTYDPTHGGVLTVTAPAPTAGGVRPQTRYSYGQIPTYAKDSTGSLVQRGLIWELTGTSTCATTSSCAGTSDEVKTTISYAGSNNGLPTSVTKGSGDGALSAVATTTYDNAGNILTVQGPLGAAQIVRFRYDAARQKVGVVGPDPDGVGPLKNRATRTTYNSDGLETLVEQGTVPGQSDGDWSSFTTLRQVSTAYDSIGRKAATRLIVGGVTQSVAQYSYDDANRQTCTAVRMNSATFGSLPSSACALADGADRITFNTYDNADQLKTVTSGYGTSSPIVEQALGYSNNGNVVTLADGNNNTTTKTYDGFDRLSQVQYPPASTGTASTVEQFSYDPASHVIQDTRRDGSLISFNYDNLGRVTTGVNGATYAYDNLGRLLTATMSGQSITDAYDALGRQTGEAGTYGAFAYQYDLAGRLAQLTWPDGFYVNYDYDVTGEVTKVRENGASSGAGVLASYVYDDLGNRKTVTRGNGVTSSYSYDTASRLASLAQDLAGTANDLTLTFSYNAANQITSRTSTNSLYDWPGGSAASRAYTSNALNQLTTSGSLTLNYDGRGNLASDGVNTYGYDVTNHLTTTSAGATLRYDPLGRLMEVRTGTTAAYWLRYSGPNVLAEYDSANNGALLRRYVYGPGVDEPIVWYEGAGTTDRRWLLADERGSINAVADGSGAALAANTYDEYGIPGASNLGRFQYTGQKWIPELGLYDYKARNYSPTLGRFLQTDPAGYGDGMNWYAYAHNDPVNGSDTSGLETCVQYTYNHDVYFDDGEGSFQRDAAQSYSSPLGTVCYGSNGPDTASLIGVFFPVGPAQTNPICSRAIMQPAFTSTFGQMGRDLGIDPTFIMSSALQESGWGLPHVFGTNSSSGGRPLNNLFGLTHAGGDNIAFSSVWASAQYWEADWGPYLTGHPQTIQDYAAALNSNPRHMYNRDPSYPSTLAKDYRAVKAATAACGTKF